MSEPAIDDVDDYAGPPPVVAELRSNLEIQTLACATYLRPEALEVVMGSAELEPSLRDFFLLPLLRQREELAAALEAVHMYSPDIIHAIAETPRHLLVPAHLSPISYLNAPIVVRGTVALISPWLAAYTALRLRIRAGARVMVLGFGQGFASLVFSRLVGDDGQVVALEIDKRACDWGRYLTATMNIDNIKVVAGNALEPSWTSYGNFDAVWASLASRTIPTEWFLALGPGGRLGVFAPPSIPSSKSSRPLEYVNAGDWWLRVAFSVYEQDLDISMVSTMPGVTNAPMLPDAASSSSGRDYYPKLQLAQDQWLAYCARLSEA